MNPGAPVSLQYIKSKHIATLVIELNVFLNTELPCGTQRPAQGDKEKPARTGMGKVNSLPDYFPLAPSPHTLQPRASASPCDQTSLRIPPLLYFPRGTVNERISNSEPRSSLDLVLESGQEGTFYMTVLYP